MTWDELDLNLAVAEKYRHPSDVDGPDETVEQRNARHGLGTGGVLSAAG